MTDTTTIKQIEYNILAIVPVDPVLYPRRAKLIKAVVYLQRGTRGNVYSTVMGHNGLIERTSVINCGKWSAEDIQKLENASE